MTLSDSTEDLIKEKALLVKWLKKYPSTHKRFVLRQDMCIKITQELNRRDDNKSNT